MHAILFALTCFLATTLVISTASAQGDIVKNLEFDVDGVLPSSVQDIDFVSSATETDLFSVFGGLLEQRTVGLLGGVGAQYAFPNSSLTGNVSRVVSSTFGFGREVLPGHRHQPARKCSLPS